ncbi:putative major facilitator superfamily domain-containing protein [Rosa chinensis]|uniref:Putative major facilitator superfamily domain-containing protein n=1 Tax=Rosa chinensis TaxID=74649 RepID=A0A2P6RQU2_ROSCH|nr:putative major facilitator superfamily domain-containing protein [Rosa chinensis]
MGIDGWRIAFHLVGLISLIVGILVLLFTNDPHYVQNNDRAKDEMPHTLSEEVKDLIKESKSVIKIPTFQILIAQGVFGSFPWSGLSFAPLWLELISFSHKETAVLNLDHIYNWRLTWKSLWRKNGGCPCKTVSQC